MQVHWSRLVLPALIVGGAYVAVFLGKSELGAALGAAGTLLGVFTKEGVGPTQ